MSVRKLSFCAMCIALAVVTGLIRIFSFPFGGSVTLCSMLFIILPGWLYGPSAGLICGLIYGMISFLISPYFVSFLQFFLDYILAFGIMGIAGFFRNMPNGLIKGYLAAVTGRWITASVAGLVWISIGSVAWEGWAPLPYTMTYNGIYIFAEAAVTVLLLLIPAVRNAFSKARELALKP